MNHNAKVFYESYNMVLQKGQLLKPRGEIIREIEDMSLYLNPAHTVLTAFNARKLNLAYAKREMMWYLCGDKFDDSITQYASMWQKLKQEDGSFYSNYGQYLFAVHGNGYSQFEYVYHQLVHDADSRRASIVLLQPYHLYHTNTDTVCTYAMNFRIRNMRLNMSVMMRSNDMVFGLTNDSFCFWNVYLMMFALLKQHYPGLQYGIYNHFANSMHIYDRHFDMVGEILKEGLEAFTDIDVPRPTFDEVWNVLAEPRDVHGPWTEWLHKL